MDAVDGLLRGEAAVADGGVHLVHRAEGRFLEQRGFQIRAEHVAHRNAEVLELGLERHAAVDDVLFAALFLEPLADLAARFAGLGDLEPVAAGAVRILGGQDLDDVAVFELIVERSDAAVDLCARHAVADGGVDGVGEVDGRCTGREVCHVAARGEDKDLVGKHIDLERVDEFFRVGVLLVFEKAAHPFVVVLTGIAGDALLILPVRGNAVFGDLVHLLGADLHLEGDTVRADDRGVERLVHVRLGCADIVLEAAEDRAVQVVNDAEHVVAVRHGVDDDAEREEVEHLVHRLILRIHLAVDAVGVLHAPVDPEIGNVLLFEARFDLRLHALHEGLVLALLFFKRLGDLRVTDGVEIFERQILKLPLDALHTEAVGDGRVDLHRFKRLLPLLFGRLILHGAHVVRAVGKLDENDADVLGHGHEHLAQVLHLLFFLAGVLHARQLGNALDKIRHRGRELLGDLGVGGGGILDAVVHEGGLDGLRVQPQLLGDDLRNGERMGDKRRAVLAELAVVMGVGIAEGLVDLGEVSAGIILAHRLDQMVVHAEHELCLLAGLHAGAGSDDGKGRRRGILF